MYNREKEKLIKAFNTLPPDDLFEKISKAPVKKISSEEELFSELAEHEEEKRRVCFRIPAAIGSLAAVAVCLFLFLVGGQTKEMGNQIIFDVNPSIRFIVDEDNEVTEICALNKDAGKIVETLPESGNLVVVTEALLKCLGEKRYLEQDGMLISFDYQHVKPPETLLKNTVSQWMREEKRQVSVVYQTVSLNEEEKKKADEQGISVGKYSFIKKLKKEYHLNTEGMNKKGIGEILEEANQQGVEIFESNDKDSTPENKQQTNETEVKRKNQEVNSENQKEKKEEKKDKEKKPEKKPERKNDEDVRSENKNEASKKIQKKIETKKNKPSSKKGKKDKIKKTKTVSKGKQKKGKKKVNENSGQNPAKVGNGETAGKQPEKPNGQEEKEDNAQSVEREKGSKNEGKGKPSDEE